jgi:DUF1680 family protein
MLRYYKLTGDNSLLQVAKQTYEAYIKRATTENYENYNWFGRPEWTEPCAVLDSYMVAVQLWMFTGNPDYLSDAQKIYYNGICFEQRVNGGFGTSQCCGAPDRKSVAVDAYEASHCCTMRGGEALSSAVQYSAFIKGNRIFLTNLIAGDYTLQLHDGNVQFSVDTDYPFTNGAQLLFNERATNLELSFFRPAWMIDVKLLLNGKETTFKEENGFVIFSGSPEKGDVLSIVFEQKMIAINAENPNSMQGVHKYMAGPLLLGVQDGVNINLPKNAPIVKTGRHSYRVGEQPMTTVYHLMEPEVKNHPRYAIQMLFEE